MTFVEMLERYRVECGVSGSPITDVTMVRGEHLKLRGWLKDAWLDIQSDQSGRWEFLRASSSYTIALNSSLLAISEWAAGTVNRWKIDSFRMADFGLPRARSVQLHYVDYDQFIAGVGLDVGTTGRPLYFTVRPGDKAILVAPTADAAYTLYYDYWSEPVELEDNGDTMPLHRKFHMLPIYRAMRDYGYFEAAPEVLARAVEKYDELIFKLELEQLPSPQWGGPLA